ncbi:MAG: beta-lactamase family protein [Xanthomonadales bacterium]|nr:beta-lactamase family protein [Xanthomonadales bacterium]MCB1640739.1 beta-lactamase family protein [Xanthomonadales bacterium]
MLLATCWPTWVLALSPCPPAPAIRAPVEGAEASVSALPDLQAEFVPRLRKLVRGDVPGVAVAVIESGRVSWAQAFGEADPQSDRAFDIDTPIPLGRWSELLLHQVAVALAQANQLALDEPLSDLPADLRWPDSPAPSLRQLLSHHSGFNGGRLHGLYADPSQPAPTVAPEQYAVRPPGWLESYSLVGLQQAMSRIDLSLQEQGSSLESAIAGRLQQILGKDCQRPSLGHGNHPQLAVGHREGDALPRMIARERLPLSLHGSLRGAIALLSPLTDADPGPIWTAMLAVQNADAALDFDRRVGLGLDLVDSQRPRVGRVALLFGAAPGYRAEARIALEHRLAVIVLANGSDEDSLGELPGDLLDAVLEARLGIPRRDREPELPAAVAYPAGLTPTNFADRYATPFGRLRVESRFDGGFDFELFGRGFRARRRADGWYGISYRLWGFIPLNFKIFEQTLLGNARRGEHELLLAHLYGRTLLLGSTPTGTTPSVEMDSWLGDYRLQNPDLLTRSLKIERLILLRENADLVLEYHLPAPFLQTLKPRVLLETADPRHLRVAGLGPLLGERLRLQQSGDQRSVEYAGYRFVRQ